MQAACYESLPPSRALLLTLRAKSEASVGQGGQTMLPFLHFRPNDASSS